MEVDPSGIFILHQKLFLENRFLWERTTQSIETENRTTYLRSYGGEQGYWQWPVPWLKVIYQMQLGRSWESFDRA